MKTELSESGKRSALTVAAMWQLAVSLLSALLLPPPVLASDVTAGAAPTPDQCIAFHVEGQAQRQAGAFTAAANSLRQCLHPGCSPLLRADCAAILQAVDRITPTVVFAAKNGEVDLVNVSVRAGDRLITEKLDGRPIALDAGPLELTFAAEGMLTATRTIVLRAGEKNRLISVVLLDEAPARAGEPAVVVVPPSSPQRAESAGSVPPKTEPRVMAWDYALIGAGLAAGGAGVFVGLTARQDAREAEGACKPDCGDSRVRAIRRKALIADSLFALSAATLVYATIRISLRARRNKSPRALIGPAFIGGQVFF